MGKNKHNLSPLVSVILCTYNAEKFISNTIDSLINQSYKKIEILVRDDLSIDKTISIIKDKNDKRITIFSEKGKKRGAYGGLNFLLDKVSGKYIAIQDHDDIRHKDKIAIQIEFLEKNKYYNACGTNNINYFVTEEKLLYKNKKKGESKYVPHTTLVIRNKGEMYPLKQQVRTDRHFMKKISPIYLLPYYYCIHYMHDNNLSQKREKITILEKFKQLAEGVSSISETIIRCIEKTMNKKITQTFRVVFFSKIGIINFISKNTIPKKSEISRIKKYII